MAAISSDPARARTALVLALWTLVLVALGARAGVTVCVGGDCCPLRFATELASNELILVHPAEPDRSCCNHCCETAGTSDDAPQPMRLRADCCPDCCLDLTLGLDPAPMPRAVAAPTLATLAGPNQALGDLAPETRESAPTPRQTGPPRGDRRTAILLCTILRQ